MPSRSNRTGFLLIDHSASPGTVAVPEGQRLEADVLSCSHCQRQVIVRLDRARERPYCRSCDHYICDDCAVVATLHGECRPFARVFEQAYEQAVRGLPVKEFSRG